VLGIGSFRGGLICVTISAMSKENTLIQFNHDLRLAISDVDETIADLYKKAEPEMIKELTKLLKEGKVLFFISGQSVESINWRIVDCLPRELRYRVFIGHCSGCEVWGFD